MTLFRCSCGYRLIVDEGKTFAIHLGHWRVNKETGRVTARCPRCPVEHVIDAGSGDGTGIGAMGANRISVEFLRLVVGGADEEPPAPRSTMPPTRTVLVTCST